MSLIDKYYPTTGRAADPASASPAVQKKNLIDTFYPSTPAPEPTPQPAPPPSILSKAGEVGGRLVSKAKTGITETAATVVQNLKFVISTAPSTISENVALLKRQIKAQPPKEKKPGLIREVISQPITPVTGLKAAKDFVSGLVGKYVSDIRQAEEEGTSAIYVESKYKPKNLSQAIGGGALSFLDSIVEFEMSGQAGVASQGIKSLGAIAGTSKTVAKVIAPVDQASAAVKQGLNRLLLNFRKIDITFEDLRAVTRGVATPKQAENFKIATEAAKKSGIKINDVVKMNEKTGFKLSGKVYSFFQKLNKQVGGLLRGAQKEEQKLLSAPKTVRSVIEPGEHTSQDVIAKVVANKLEKTPGGKEIIKLATQAQVQGAGITVERVPVKYVDPKTYAKSIKAEPAGTVDIETLKLPEGAEIDRTQVEAVKSSIDAGDKINPLVVDEQNVVQDGAHRLTALREMGVKEAEIVRPTQPKGVGGVYSSAESEIKLLVPGVKTKLSPSIPYGGSQKSLSVDFPKGGTLDFDIKDNNIVIWNASNRDMQGNIIKGQGDITKVIRWLIDLAKKERKDITISGATDDGYWQHLGFDTKNHMGPTMKFSGTTQPKGVAVKEELILKPSQAKKESELIEEVGRAGVISITPKTKAGKIEAEMVYLKPPISRADLLTLLKSSDELSKNPVLAVVQGEMGKQLEFVGQKLKFKMNVSALRLNEKRLEIGQKIRLDEEALKKGVGVQQARVYRGGETYASRGVFSELENLTKKLDKENLKVVEFPEIVRMARELMGQVPKVTAGKRGKYLGYFRPGKGGEMGQIVLKVAGMKDPEVASKLLAHELGHLTDFLPDLTMARGNVVGRVATLRKHLERLYGDLDNKVVRKELADLSAKWRPIADGKGTAEDLVGNKYRSKPQELYADAISVLFNDPVRLKQEAPEFYKGFFEYLDRKPAAKEVFEGTWNLLNQGDEAVFNARDEEMARSFAKGEEVFAAKELEKSKRSSSLMYQLNLLFNDKNTPIINKINMARKAGKQIPAELNPDFALKGLNYYEGELKNYVADNFQPIFALAQQVPDGWNQLGKTVFYERVINERGELANPQGYNPKTAQFQLEQMEKSMSSESWQKLQEAKDKFRGAVQKSVDLAEKNGFYSPEMLAIMKANPAYATYQVIDHLDTYISAKAYRSVGTLKDIANPATSTVMKLVSVHKAIKRNNAKLVNTKFLQDNFPESIQKARTRWNGKFMEVKDPTDPQFGLVVTVENGKPQGYYIEKAIADMLNHAPNPTLDAAARVSRALTQSRLYRPLFTSFNLGFQSFNFVRDFNRYWKNVPDKTLGEAITSLPRAVLRYSQAVKPSLRRVVAKPDEIIKAMENANILGLSYNDMFRAAEDTDIQQIERVLQKAGVLEKQKKFWILRPFEWVLDGVASAGNFIETLPKVAGYIELKNKLPEKELAQFIRTAVGSPDFRVGGSMTPVTNNIFLFSNAIKEGVKTDMGIAFGRNPSRAGFWWKTVVSNFLPKLIMAGVAAGYFGNKLQEMMNKVSEYDKTNYTILPLGLDENGKVIYLRIPADETGRFMGGLLWKLLPQDKDQKLSESVFDLFSFGAGQFPNLSPSLTGAGVIVQYLSGKNPYDDFRGRPIIPETEFKAGFTHSLPILMDWLVKNQGLGIIVPNYKPKDPTDLEKTLNAPFISNILGRWLKVGNYGEVESLREVGEGLEQESAVRILNERKKVDAAIEEYKKDPSQKGRIEKELVQSVVGKPPYKEERKTKQANTIKKFRIGIVRGENDPYVNSLIDADTNAAKVEILKEIKKRLPDEGFKRIYDTAKKNKIISDNVIKDFRRATK